MKSMIKKAFCGALVAAMLAAAIPAQALWAASVVEDAVAGANSLVAATDYKLAPGVTETAVLLNNEAGDAQVAGFMTTVDPSAEISFKASYNGYYTAGSTPESRKEAAAGMRWSMARTSSQAADYERATGENVIFATNGDYYNMQTGQPLGYLIMEGNVIQGRGEPYFAVLKDGTYAFRDAGADASDVAEAVSGPFFMIRDGEIVYPASDRELAPRNSIGRKADGTIVTYVADGRQDPYSVGQTVYETAEFLKSQGVVEAIYLDGGGSATYASQREGTDELIVRNSPSDGVERTVSSALLMVLNAQPDGVFDHAVLSPNNTQYTPGSAIRFSAVGVDTAGGKAALPSDIEWIVTDGAAGSIDADGLFTANAGYIGAVTVVLRAGGETVGETTVTIRDADTVFFTGDAISLDYGEVSDLGLVVQAGKREINYKSGDFAWTVESKTAGVTAGQIGAFDGNRFVAGTYDGTMTGSVTLTYTTADGEILTDSIDVEIGKMPFVYLDFEPDENGELAQAAHYHWGSPDAAFRPYNGDGYMGNGEPVTVVTRGTYTDNPTYATINPPFLFNGNWDVARPAADIFRANGYDYYLWTGAITEYGAGGLKNVTKDLGGQVRFGEGSLEFNYNYATYTGSGNSNYYIRYSGEQIDIEGYPTELGVWIYAPEGTDDFMPYIQIGYWNGRDYATFYAALEPQTKANPTDAGITWTGWMYCKVDSTSLHQYISAEHPLKLMPGNGIFWLSFQPGAQKGSRTNGTLYFDNFRAVYGTNLDDLVNPVISEVTLNGTTLTEGGSGVFEADALTLNAQYDDPASANRSGMASERTMVYFDGELIAADKSDTAVTTRTTLNNGRHTVTVVVYDAFGNSDTKTYSFTVDVPGKTTPQVSISGADTVTMGSTYTVTMTADGAVTAAEATLAQLNADFGEPVVTFMNGFTGTATYTETGYKKAALAIDATGNGAGDICTVTFDVPTDLDPEIDFFTYNVSTITYTGADGGGYSAAQPLVKLPLSAYYTVEADLVTQGAPFEIRVAGPDGAGAADVFVYLNGSLVGQTDQDGKLTTDATVQMTGGTTFVLTASDEKGVSFETTCTVLATAGGTDGKPVGIHLNAAADNAAEQSIGWMANPVEAAGAAVVRFMREADYEQIGDLMTAQSITGTSVLTAFPTTKNAALVNEVTVTGLEPDTTYCYIVGDGVDGHWSGVMTFKTKVKGTDTRFLVIGDTQMTGNPAADADAIAILNEIAESSGSDFDFAIQTGDFVDNGGNYSQWAQILNEFQDNFGGMDFAHTLGNHEYYGDIPGGIANALLDVPGEDYYSVEYGDVYVAVINNSASLNTAAEWLVEDAAQSDCAWKILSIHQPPYYTNPTGGSGAFNAVIPAAADAAGIDVVFSGHDHSYARTEPMMDGIVDATGTTYFISGDLGEKSRDANYAIVEDPAFHFAKTSQDYAGLYITVETEGGTMTVTAHDADGSVIDAVTMMHADAVEQPFSARFGEKAVATVANNTNETLAGKAILAVYDQNGVLAATESVGFETPSGNAEAIEFDLDLNAYPVSEYGYRVFFWDADDIPLTEAVS